MTNEETHTLEEWRALCLKNYCRWCNASLPLELRYYRHPNGWLVKGMKGRQWLYVKCARCNYDFSLWKLGVEGGGHDV